MTSANAVREQVVTYSYARDLVYRNTDCIYSKVKISADNSPNGVTTFGN